MERRRVVFSILISLLLGSPLYAAETSESALGFLSLSQADLDGDGGVTLAEQIAFEQLLAILEPDNPVLIEIVLRYGHSVSDGKVGVVDLSPVFEPYAVSGGAYGEVKDAGACQVFIRGDANGDNNVNIADGPYILSYLFSQGPPPVPLDAGVALHAQSLGSLQVVWHRMTVPFQVPPIDCWNGTAERHS